MINLIIKLNKHESGYDEIISFLSSVKSNRISIEDSKELVVELNSEINLTTLKKVAWKNAAGLNENGLTISYSVNNDEPVQFVFIPTQNICSISTLRKNNKGK